MHQSDVLITDQLHARAVSALRLADLAALVPFPLSGQLAAEDVLAERCRQVLAFCGAQSAGISIFRQNGFDTLTWIGVTGELGRLNGQTFSRENSPCSFCLTYRCAQLFRKPHLFFEWMPKAGIVMDELLVVPIMGPYGAIFGTIWAVKHAPLVTPFSTVDARALDKLGAHLWSRVNDLAGMLVTR